MAKRKPRARYGTGSLGQRGRIWHVSYREIKRRPDGSTAYIQHRVSTHSEDRGYAQRFLNAKLQELGGRRPRAVDPGDVKYEDLRAAYVAECVELHRHSLRRGTLSNFGRIDRYFAGWRVADFTIEALKEFRRACRRDGITDATTNRCIAALRRMFKIAVRDEMIQPADAPAYWPVTNEPNVARGAIFIEDAWYAPLSKELAEPLRSAFVLCYHTGMRVGEMQKLRWRDVDVEKHTVTLPAEITKTGNPRLVPLPSDFKLKPGKPDALVFADVNTREPWQAACLKLGIGKHHCRACGAICDGRVCPTHGERHVKGLGYSGPHLKHTRHTAARNMSETGESEARIMAITGHKTRAMFDRYNIGKEGDVEAMRQAIERAHQARQAKLKRRR